jgi:inner membrane protein involved in colicin E2 resistance
MTNRMVAIIFIFICSAIAWGILGRTIDVRTNTASSALNGRVESIWGSAQVQSAPTAAYTASGANAANEKQTRIQLPILASLINVDITVDYRQKGLLWYSTYRVGFSGGYTFENSTSTTQDVTFCFPLPSKKAIYDDVRMTANDQPLQLTTTNGILSGRTIVEAGSKVMLQVSYRSQGLDSWQYELGNEVAEVKNFSLAIRTHFGGFDFPENTLSPTEERKSGDGWELRWKYSSLLSGFQIGMTMPGKVQPGPLAGRISYFAPVSLLFFFFVVFMLTTLRGIEFHPMNYFFLACSFFAFHLLLAYLVDHISIHWAFVICSTVSLFLVWSYLRVVVGNRFAVEAAGAQFAYLILFSSAFFFVSFTGLTITIGAILTLFIAMQGTAKIRWAEKFARKAA